MPDQKITELIEETTAADSEPLAIVQDPSGTPVTKKIQTKNLLRKSATLIIASSTSVGGADYYCDGTADDVQIQAAIDALPSAGGKVLLREGTFTLAAGIIIAKNGVTIQGVGKGTIVTAVNSITNGSLAGSLFILGHATTQYYDCVIADLYIDGNGANQSDGQVIDNGYWKAVPIKRLEVLNCYIVNAYDSAVYSKYDTYPIVKGCHILNWLGNIDGGGINLDANTGIAANNILITNQTSRFKIGIAGTRIVSANYIEFPNSAGGKAIAQGIAGTADQVVGNYIKFGSSCTSFARGIGGAGSVFSNRIEFGTGADVASVGIDPVDTCQGNEILSPGIGIVVQSGVATNNIISNAYADGIRITASTNNQKCIVSNNQIYDPGNATDNTYSGIIVTGTTTYSVITGNTIASSAANKHKYGIREATAGDGPNIIDNNICLNAATAQISVQNVNTINGANITA